MRAVFDALDRLGIHYFVTGSVAASVHGVMRQSQDIDVVLDIDPAGLAALADSLRSTYAIAEPIDFGSFLMASAIDKVTSEKVDLILTEPLRINKRTIDRIYLDRWAATLGVSERLREVD